MLRGETFIKWEGDRMKIAGVGLIIGGLITGLILGFAVGASSISGANSYGPTVGAIDMMTIATGGASKTFNPLLFLLPALGGLISGCVLYVGGSLSDISLRLAPTGNEADDPDFNPPAQRDSWQKEISAYLTFFEENGHGRVPFDYTTADGLKLGIWFSARRATSNLTPELRAQLDQLPGWQWS